jgi:HKD family nuclease
MKKQTRGFIGLLGQGNAHVIGLPAQFSLARAISGATEIKLATAFAHPSGWKHFEPLLQKSSASLRLLTGLSFCQTDPRVLRRWWNLAKAERIQARLFVRRGVTFHPKVLIVHGDVNFALVGSGNLSNGGLSSNIECAIFTDAAVTCAHVSAWFDELFLNREWTKDLNDRDISRYKVRFDAAKRARAKVTELEEEVEEAIGERYRAGLGHWRKAVNLARRFFRTNRFKSWYRNDRRGLDRKIKIALRYPQFDFDKAGLEDFYKIRSLGHLIEVAKNSVWRQKTRLQSGLRYLVDESEPIETRLAAVVDGNGKFHVDGAGLNFISKVLAAHAPQRFTVFNGPVAKALKSFNYESPRGYTASQKYLEFCRLMQSFMKESGAPNSLALDCFFFDQWERITNSEENHA